MKVNHSAHNFRLFIFAFVRTCVFKGPVRVRALFLIVFYYNSNPIFFLFCSIMLSSGSSCKRMYAFYVEILYKFLPFCDLYIENHFFCSSLIYDVDVCYACTFFLLYSLFYFDWRLIVCYIFTAFYLIWHTRSRWAHDPTVAWANIPSTLSYISLGLHLLEYYMFSWWMCTVKSLLDCMHAFTEQCEDREKKRSTNVWICACVYYLITSIKRQFVQQRWRWQWLRRRRLWHINILPRAHAK